MPTLILENMPHRMYENLQRRAAADQRSIPDETMHLLQQVLDVEKRPRPTSSPSVDEDDDLEAERPWRGVFVPPRQHETLFVQAVNISDSSLPKRPMTFNMGWHRTEPNDA